MINNAILEPLKQLNNGEHKLNITLLIQRNKAKECIIKVNNVSSILLIPNTTRLIEETVKLILE